MASIDIRLKKVSKVYHEGESLCGVVIIQSKGDSQHQGIYLGVEGSVNLQLSAKSVGLFEAFYNSLKPIQLLHYAFEIAKPGKVPAGKTEIPFEVPLVAKGNKELHETYHGVFVNIQYMARAEMKRSLLSKDLQSQVEFIIEYGIPQETPPPKPFNFNLTPDTLHQVKERGRVPRFQLKGRLDNNICNLTKPFTGELIVEHSEVAIKSIELQLVRVETCGCAEGYAKDATEIQNIQIAEGDVCKSLRIPIYMIFPRLFTCPTLATNNFKIEFEVNIVIVFQDDHLVTENFPIKLYRAMSVPA